MTFYLEISLDASKWVRVPVDAGAHSIDLTLPDKRMMRLRFRRWPRFVCSIMNAIYYWRCLYLHPDDVEVDFVTCIITVDMKFPIDLDLIFKFDNTNALNAFTEEISFPISSGG